MRNLIVIACLFGTTTVLAQNYHEIPATKGGPFIHYQSTSSRNVAPSVNRGGGGIIWSDDFSNPSTWVIDHDASVTTLDWQIGMNLGGSGDIPLDTINSTTRSNGYALLDSDAHNQGSVMEDSWITTASSINLSSYADVVIEFESQYFKWDNEECYVVISTNNTDWPELTPTTDISGMPNVFHTWPGMQQQEEIFNATHRSIDISAAAGGQSTVWVRFHWTGVWGYNWYVDDVVIREHGDYDLRLDDTFFSHNNTAHQYGRIPVNQTNQTKLMGGEVFNFGHVGLSNLTMNASFSGPTPINASGTASTLAVATTDTIFGPTSTGPLAVGTYNGSYTVGADNDQPAGAQFENNTMTRKFEVSDTRYSKDVIGVNDQVLTEFGGTATTNNGDGTTPLTYYDVVGTLDVTGIEIVLQSFTQVGSQVMVGLYDTTGIAPGVTSITPVTQSNLYTITAADTIAGIAKVWFQTPYNLNSNAYYAAASLFTGPDNKIIGVLDDKTFAQPFNSSHVFIPGQQIFTNGEAYAIRLMLDSPPVGIEDVNEDENLTIQPNPNSGLFDLRISDIENGLLTIEVVDVQGKNVYTGKGFTAGNQFHRQFDLTNVNSGIYTMMIMSENGQIKTERFIKQ